MPQASKLNECTERKDWKAIKSVPEKVESVSFVSWI